jgi:hypothetical protein
MPRGDATGSMEMGPMIGRKAGYCMGFGRPGYANNAGGRGFGMGFGRRANFDNRGGQGGGFGRRNQFFATGMPGRARFGGFAAPFQKIDTETEKQALQRQADLLQSEMDAIKERLGELTAKG